MRILIAVHGYPPTHYGGAERRAERTARGLKARGHDVRVLCIESVTDSASALRWEDQVQDDIPVRRLFFNLGASPDPFRWSYDNPDIRTAFEMLLQEWSPDVMHLFSGYLMSSSVVRGAAAHRIPVVISLTDYWWLCHRINLLRTDGTRCTGPTPIDCARCQAETFRRYRLPGQLWPGVTQKVWHAISPTSKLGEQLGMPEQIHRAAILRETLRLADVLIAPSQYLANTYIRHGIDPARIKVWRQGVERDHCLLRTSDPALRVGYLGQMKEHKGVHLLLDAWSKLRSPRPRRLALYGSATGEELYAQRLRTMLHPLKDAAWKGSFKGAEVWEILANLDVLVVPSRWVENSPNSILEAQAVGVPIVGSNLGGIAELVQHEYNGLLFAVDNAADLARQLQRLLDEPDLLPKLWQARPPFLSHEDSLDQLDGLYPELLTHSHNALLVREAA